MRHPSGVRESTSDLSVPWIRTVAWSPRTSTASTPPSATASRVTPAEPSDSPSASPRLEYAISQLETASVASSAEQLARPRPVAVVDGRQPFGGRARTACSSLPPPRAASTSPAALTQ